MPVQGIDWTRGVRRNLIVAGAVVLLSACQPGTGPAALSGVDAGAPRAMGPADGQVDPDYLRAPELFRASGLAKWNGLETVRGVWVAHPRARAPRRVRIVNGLTGVELDGMVYPTRKSGRGYTVTLSSDAARGLGIEKGAETPVALFALRPHGSQSPEERAELEARAETELAARIWRMEDTELLHLVAATMRGRGFATTFEDGPAGTSHPVIRAVSLPGASPARIPVRVVVRPRSAEPARAEDIAALQEWLAESGYRGVLVSVAGFAEDVTDGLDPEAPQVDLVDLSGLSDLWLSHYEQMTPPDRALLQMRPVYFPADT